MKADTLSFSFGEMLYRIHNLVKEKLVEDNCEL